MQRVNVHSHGTRSIRIKYCALCSDAFSMVDTSGYQWCEKHQNRGELLDWGSAHSYPDLQCPPYAIGPGRSCWVAAMTLGINDFVSVALASIKE